MTSILLAFIKNWTPLLILSATPRLRVMIFSKSKPKRGTRVRDPAHWNHLDPDVLRWLVEVTDTEVYLKKMFDLRRRRSGRAARCRGRRR